MIIGSLKLKLPYVEQSLTYTCGPAALQMVLRYFDQKVGHARLVELLETNKDTGTRRRRLVEAAQAHGMYVHEHVGASLAELLWFVRQSVPVIVNYREPDNEVGHYAVVAGFSWWRIILHDPWHGPEFRLPVWEFAARWHGQHKTTNRRWMLAISPQPINGPHLKKA